MSHRMFVLTQRSARKGCWGVGLKLAQDKVIVIWTAAFQPPRNTELLISQSMQTWLFFFFFKIFFFPSQKEKREAPFSGIWLKPLCKHCRSDGKVPWQLEAKECRKDKPHNEPHTRDFLGGEKPGGGCLCLSENQQQSEQDTRFI